MSVCLCSARQRYVISDHREKLRQSHRTKSPASDLASPTVDVLQKYQRGVQALGFYFGHFEACGSSRSWVGTTQQEKRLSRKKAIAATASAI
ncbi:hypothetical protein T03_6656 [Trichinella britovi]|uniref:Uncharacterized protein n=1 Tax=Trichinella britovi TaxID=45882 RepID=A0A0V1CL39_TRIBR|nr:hypothetical protein T03_6656 [Trichinella britovi]